MKFFKSKFFSVFAHVVVSGVIGGAATGVTQALTTGQVTNLTSLGSVAAVGAVVGVLGVLKSSPLDAKPVNAPPNIPKPLGVK